MGLRQRLTSLVGRGEAPTPGSQAPELDAMSTEGRRVRADDLRGTPWVLYFYPKDETPGCTAQACDLRDNWARVQAAGARLYGVSTDSLDKHQAFIRHHGLPFPLLADPDGAVAERWGVLLQVGPLRSSRRVTFVMDADGAVTHVFDPAQTRGHTDQVLAAIKEQGA